MKITMLCLTAAVVLSCMLNLDPACAKTWHVPGDTTTIQGGIGLASTGDTVLVACGTYYEHDIRMKSGVCLRSETGEAGCVTIYGQKADRVFYCRFVSKTARIEGFTITGGLASDGGGMYFLDNSAPRIKNVMILGNSATYDGGGVYCYVNSNPTFFNCTFNGNTSDESGGGIYCMDNSSPVFIECLLTDNTGSSGGALYCFNHCTPTLDNCTITGNSGNIGGGIYCSFGCDVTLTDCTVSGNTGDWRGGGMSLWNSAATITGCTFSNNNTDGQGGGLLLIGSSVALIGGSLTGNTANTGGGIYLESTSFLSADTTEFAGNTASSSGAHGYVESGSELVLTCSVTDLSGFAGDGTIILNNDGCDTSVEESTWSRLKAMFRLK